MLDTGLNRTPWFRVRRNRTIELKVASSITTPSTSRARNIWELIRREKVAREQANRIILNLDDSSVTLPDLKRQFDDWPMPGLKEVIVVRGGRVIPFWP